MRIGVNLLFLLPAQVGGTETYVRNLLPALLDLDRAPDLVLFTNRENHETFEGFERVALGVKARSRTRRILAEQLLLPAAAARARVDILFSPGYTAPLRARVPQVVTIHDAQFRAHPEDFPAPARWAHAFFVTRAARAADAVLAVSQFARGELRERLGVPDAKIRVTGEAPAPPPPEPWPLPPGVSPPFLLCVGNTYPHKNIRPLAEVFARNADDIPHRLVIVGQPRAGEPAPHPRIQRIHRLSPPELFGLYRACDLFVFPSRYEGFGLPVAEAMAAGARVAAARAAAVPEVAGDAATYFDPDDPDDIARAIREALGESPERRRALVEAGRARAASFTWAACARRTLDAFSEVAERAAASRRRCDHA